ncbi:MAG: hypothetical protein E6J90_03780 [Deltaproteobacteria bacterium]|nr:MAG: hypothetical protein E6J90_03780 [Deltaproteobacteria bacterium]
MHQGRMNRARDALAEADHAAGSAGDRLLLMLESASVIIYCDFAIGEALQAADRAKPNAAGAAIDPNRAPVRTRRRAAQLYPDRQSGGFLGTMRCTVERGRLAPMTAAVKAVLEQAMQLSPEERAEVANALDGMSADAPALSPDDLAAAWRPELDRRREELQRGEVQTVDAREAIAGIRARLRSGK